MPATGGDRSNGQVEGRVDGGPTAELCLGWKFPCFFASEALKLFNMG
jgi:hypothetical protein